MEKRLSNDMAYSTGRLAPPRWNVLDLLEHISRYSESVHLFCDIDGEAIEALAENLSVGGQKVTVTAILLKAISIAQLSHLNSASFRLPFGYIYKRDVPIAGFTVEREVDGQQAVFFGNIKDAQSKLLIDIARELAAYGRNDVDTVTQLSKERILSKIPYALRQILVPLGCYLPFVREIINPATFGLTSLGKFGLGVVVAPNVTTSIFGIGPMESKPVVVNGQVEIRKIMPITYSVDNKICDYHSAARFLKDIKDILESGLAGYLHESELEALDAAAQKQAEITAEEKQEKSDQGEDSCDAQNPCSPEQPANLKILSKKTQAGTSPENRRSA
ncbi:MAG: 2-oxo acid dehydrogenase subunit E2 [Cyanobacteria bacterium REEB67]|nr:2-oxo acid dehydrogenase subunit E2 [Cyanobacteria bacterium REEB67]